MSEDFRESVALRLGIVDTSEANILHTLGVLVRNHDYRGDRIEHLEGVLRSIITHQFLVGGSMAEFSAVKRMAENGLNPEVTDE